MREQKLKILKMRNRKLMKNRTINLFLPIFILFLAIGNFAQTAPQEKSVLVFGAKIRYLEAGDVSKPTVILLHGLGGSAENWHFNPAISNILPLAANFHILAPDQIGF